MLQIVPFPISISEHDLDDLHRRLDLTRLPEPETVPDATQGRELDRLKILLNAWRQHDWRGLEARRSIVWSSLRATTMRPGPVRDGGSEPDRSRTDRGRATVGWQKPT